MIIYIAKSNVIDNIEKLSNKILRYSLKERYGLNIADLILDRNEYGKPYLKGFPNINFSISHCEKLIACGIDEENLGIDVERIRKYDDYVANRICSEFELEYINKSSNSDKAFFSIWTLKESLGKYLGVGLNYPLKEVTFKLCKNHIYSTKENYKFRLYEIYDEFILAICTTGDWKKILLKEVGIRNDEFY